MEVRAKWSKTNTSANVSVGPTLAPCTADQDCEKYFISLFSKQCFVSPKAWPRTERGVGGIQPLTCRLLRRVRRTTEV